MKPPDGPSRQPGPTPKLVALLLLFDVLVLLAVAAKGPIMRPDSSSYVSAALYRPPLYPLLLSVSQSLFGDSAFRLVVLGQAALGGSAAMVLVLFLRQRLQLGSARTFFCNALLLFPYYNFSIVQGYANIANVIMTEAVAYALFLIALRYLLAGLLDRDDRAFALYLLCTLLLILTRPQFLFLHIASLLAILYMGLRRRSVRRVAVVLGVFVFSAASVPLLERASNLVRHQRFVKVPFTHYQLLAGVLYVSDAEDVHLLRGDAAVLLANVYARASAQGLLLSSGDSPATYLYNTHHYKRSYNAIVWNTLKPELSSHLGRTNQPVEEILLQGNALLRTVNIVLLRDNFFEFMRLYLSNIHSSIGLGEMVVLLAALVAALPALYGREDPAALALAVAVLLHLLNAGLVALVEPTLSRYTFYTEITYAACLALFLLQTGRSVALRHLGRTSDLEGADVAKS